MKIPSLIFCAVLGLTISIAAQTPADPTGPTQDSGSALSVEELDQLLGPIALYPDALIAFILPASTHPTDIVLAARELERSGDKITALEARPWDDSVKSLARYPDIVRWLDTNLDWTNQLGAAFLAQPAEVMNAVQRLRTRAMAAGSLVDSPQQTVLVSPAAIRIVPAQPEVIYVPRYEPSVVFVERPAFHPLPPLAFGFGLPVGSWLAYDLDWGQRKVWVGDRHRPWRGHDWSRPLVSARAGPSLHTATRHWHPSARQIRVHRNQPSRRTGPVSNFRTPGSTGSRRHLSVPPVTTRRTFTSVPQRLRVEPRTQRFEAPDHRRVPTPGLGASSSTRHPSYRHPTPTPNPRGRPDLHARSNQTVSHRDPATISNPPPLHPPRSRVQTARPDTRFGRPPPPPNPVPDHPSIHTTLTPTLPTLRPSLPATLPSYPPPARAAAVATQARPHRTGERPASNQPRGQYRRPGPPRTFR